MCATLCSATGWTCTGVVTRVVIDAPHAMIRCRNHRSRCGIVTCNLSSPKPSPSRVLAVVVMPCALACFPFLSLLHRRQLQFALPTKRSLAFFSCLIKKNNFQCFFLSVPDSAFHIQKEPIPETQASFERATLSVEINGLRSATW